MHTKNIAKLSLWVVIINLWFPLSSKAQDLLRPVAHYPLDVQLNYSLTRYELRTWDASGNAYHANTVNLENKGQVITTPNDHINDGRFWYNWFPENAEASSKFDKSKRAFVYEGFTCIKNDNANDDPYINIPDFSNHNLMDYQNDFKGFTISFWLYWDATNSSKNMPIIASQDFGVNVVNGEVYLHYADPNTNAHLSVKSGEKIYYGEGWYFIAAAIDKNVLSNKTVKFYYDRYPSVSSKSIDSITVTNAFQTAVDPAASGKGKIMGQFQQHGFDYGDPFVGSLSNLRIYDQKLSADALEVLVENDLSAPNTLTKAHRLRRPYAHYSFDGSNAAEYQKNEVGDFGPRHISSSTGTISSVANRFSKSRKAIKLAAGAQMNFPAFFGDNYLSNFNPYDIENPKGFTFSFWIKIDENLTSSTQTVSEPFDKANDAINQLFVGESANGDPLFGLELINDRIGLYRYTEINGVKHKWYLWMYDPMSFRNRGQGWYHIVWSYASMRSMMYMWEPNTDVSDCQCGTGNSTCVCRALNFELQDLSDVTNWKIAAGKDLILDDVKIYNYPISEDEAKALHTYDQSEENYEAVVADHDEIDVFILLGQSNMAGRCESAWLTDVKSCPIVGEEPLDDVYLLDHDANFVNMSPALARYSNIGKQYGGNGAPDYFLGPNVGYSFAKRLQELGKDEGKFQKIGLIVNPRGGIYTRDWKKHSTYTNYTDNPYHLSSKNAYQEVVRRFNDMKVKYPKARLRGILWLQGESEWDASNSTVWKRPQYFLDTMSAVVDSMRVTFDQDDLPMLFGECSQRTVIDQMITDGEIDPDWIPDGWDKAFFKDHNYTTINQEINKLPNRNPQNYVVSSADLKTIRDGTHYLPESYNTYGIRFAEKFYNNVEYTHSQLAIIGDYGCNGTGGSTQEVADMIKGWDPDFIISLGDDNYSNQSDCANNLDTNSGYYFADYLPSPYPTDEYKALYPEATFYSKSADAPIYNRFFSTPGNHDYTPYQQNNANLEKWKAFFSNPTQFSFAKDNASGSESYYSYKQGNVHIFVINTNKIDDANKDASRPHDYLGYTKGSTQYKWLQKELAASKSQYPEAFRLVIMHRSPYTSTLNVPSFEAEKKQMSIALQEWDFKALGASIVLAGDDHYYERIVKYGDLNYIVNGYGGTHHIKNVDEEYWDDNVAVHYDNNNGGYYGALKVEEVSCPVIGNYKGKNSLYFQFIPANSATQDALDEFYLFPNGDVLQEPDAPVMVHKNNELWIIPVVATIVVIGIYVAYKMGYCRRGGSGQSRNMNPGIDASESQPMINMSTFSIGE